MITPFVTNGFYASTEKMSCHWNGAAGSLKLTLWTREGLEAAELYLQSLTGDHAWNCLTVTRILSLSGGFVGTALYQYPPPL